MNIRKIFTKVLMLVLCCMLSFSVTAHISAAATEKVAGTEAKDTKEIVLVRGISQVKMRTSEDTVEKTLEELDIYYKADKVYPNLDTEITEGMKIFVLRDHEVLHTYEREIEIPVKYINTDDILYGDSKLIKQGAPGKARVVTKINTAKEPNKVYHLAEEVVQEPVHSVMHIGTGMSVDTPQGRMRYKKIMDIQTTAYTIHCGSGTGLTYTGIVPYVGVVAVDPKVIPLHTKMYIPGYGVAVAEDTGGAIKGKIVDLFMDSLDEAWQWGRRDVRIYILED